MLRCPRTYSGRASVLFGRSVCTVTTVGAHRRRFHGRPRTGRGEGARPGRQRRRRRRFSGRTRLCRGFAGGSRQGLRDTGQGLGVSGPAGRVGPSAAYLAASARPSTPSAALLACAPGMRRPGPVPAADWRCTFRVPRSYLACAGGRRTRPAGLISARTAPDTPSAVSTKCTPRGAPIAEYFHRPAVVHVPQQ